jgi:hypothetical protein
MRTVELLAKKGPECEGIESPAQLAEKMGYWTQSANQRVQSEVSAVRGRSRAKETSI